MNNPQLPTSASVARFLHNDGWKRFPVSNTRLLGFRSPESIKDDFGKSIILTIPSRPGFYDESAQISSVLDLLSEIKQTTKERLIFLIKNLNSDIFDQRIFGSDIRGLSMEVILDVMKCLKNLIYYSACATAEASDDITGSRKTVKECMEKCLFVQTFPGSFGMRLEMPLPRSFNNPLPIEMEAEDELHEPFERRVMKRIYNGLNFAVKGQNEGDVDIVIQNYKTGFNANLCDAMAKLTGILSDYTLGYTFAWSNEYSIDSGYVRQEEICIPSKDYNDLFASAAKSLRASSESSKKTISGEIIDLHSELEEDLILSDKQFIIIAWKQNYKITKVRIKLSQNDYRKACDAHRDKKKVSFTGILEKQGKYYTLTNSSDFQVLQ